MSQIVRSVCPLDCPDTCSMLVTVRDSRAVELKGNPDHPFTRGALCGKMNHYLEVVYSNERLRTPLRRVGPKGKGQFEPISWPAAISEIASRFDQIRNSSAGPQAILPYSYYGTMGKLQSSSLDRVFFHRIGASKLERTICASAGTLGYEYTVGAGRFGADPLAVTKCKLILNWGSNTVQTNAHLWSFMVEARKHQGAKLICIDPYQSETAQRSDLHLPIRPGTDAALALGLMHVIFREGWQDQDYLDRFCVGSDQLRERALLEYSPEKVSRITGLQIAAIEQLAHDLARIQPSLIRLNYGLQRHYGGGMAVRTIACLPAVTGSWRYAGGGALLSTSGIYDLNSHDVTRPDLSPELTRTVNMNQLGEALSGELPGPPVKALYVYNCNPAAVSPNQMKVLDGLRREDLFTVVHDLFQTDTADFADIILPATSQLEHEDIHGSYGHHELMHNQPAIRPLYESKPNVEVFRLLAKEMGLEAELFPDDRTLIQRMLKGGPRVSQIDYDSLSRDHSVRLTGNSDFLPYAEGRFLTESGKCELYSERMKRDGFDPLPNYTPPAEDPQGDKELVSRYPIQMISPPKGSFLNSTFGGNSWHKKRAGEPSVEISHEDASARGLTHGQWVVVENSRGKFIARALLNGRVSRGVACARGIHWNKHSPGNTGINATTSSGLTDMGGGALFFDNLVEIRHLSANEQRDLELGSVDS